MAYAQMRTPFCNILLQRWALVLSFYEIKINTIHEGWCSFLWRRKRDSNPRAFWANGFQDRLVVTASIFLHITATHRAAVICREYLHGSEKFIFQNPLRIPHAAASSSLVSGKCGYLRQSRNIPITMQNCAIIQY